MKKFYILTTTEGCATNLLENASYRENLKMSGLDNCHNLEEAELIIINTCGYTTERETYTTNTIKSLKEKYPNKEIVVGGCLPEINRSRLREVYDGETFNPGDIHQLNKILKIETPVRQLPNAANFFDEQDFDDLSKAHRLTLKFRPYYFKAEKFMGRKFQPLHNILKTTVVNNEFFSIVVSQGCLGKCTFCAIKSAKGEVKSRPISDIISDFKNGLQKGHKKFWLIGDDIGCYGYDLGIDFSDLLGRILALPDDFQLVINYFEPMWFVKLFDRMEKMLTDKRILNINFPLQSGSFKIVRRMGREYDPKIVMSKIKKIKNANSELVIKTNIIVGFPGESIGDFFQSVKSIMSFDAILPIPYTPRPGTGAIKYKDSVSEPVRDLRMSLIKLFVFLRHAQIAMGSIIKGVKYNH